jgi:hypothetical protein
MPCIRAANLLTLLVFAAACAARPASLDAIAEGYVRVALQLAQHNPDLVDDWRGAAGWRPGPREPVQPLVERVEGLRRALARHAASAEGADRDRVAYLDGQLTALGTAAHRLMGRSAGLDEEARDMLGLTAAFGADAASLAGSRDALAALWPGPGSLATRYAAYRAALTVPAPRVEGVLRVALAACRRVAAESIPLPDDERIDLVLGSGSQWDGFARYLGNHRTRIEINRDAALDVTRALRLACHEGYPGHHLQYMLIDDELVRRRGWKEFGLAPGFGPHLLVTEGAAEAGADVAFPPAPRTALYRDVLLPAAGLPPTEALRLVQVEELVASLEPAIVEIARAYLDNTITEARAIERLRDEALTPEPEALLAFAQRHRTRLLAYPLGRARAHDALNGDGLLGMARWFTSAPFALR